MNEDGEAQDGQPNVNNMANNEYPRPEYIDNNGQPNMESLDNYVDYY